MSTFTKIVTADRGRIAQLELGQGNNQQCRASDFNALVEILNNLDELTDAADDSAAATAGVEIGELYRNGSVLMVRVA